MTLTPDTDAALRAGPKTVPILAFANQKGGVGKTTITAGFAVAFAEMGLRVLAIDLDPQFNLTTRLLGEGVEPEVVGSFALLASKARLRVTEDPVLADAVQAAGPNWRGIDIAPSATDLAEIDADAAPDQPVRLADRLTADRDALVKYDVVVIDCPPQIGRLQFAAIVAATHLVLVTEPQPDSVKGLAQIERTAASLRRNFRQDHPEVAAVLINRWRPGISEHAFRVQEVRDAYGDKVLSLTVPERAAVGDAVSTGAPVQALSGPGAAAVSMVLETNARELAERIGLIPSMVAQP